MLWSCLVLLLLPAAHATCFPGFSDECCKDIQAANAKPAMSKALWRLESESGEAEAHAFEECTKAMSPCVIMLPNGTQVAASCCNADALKGWYLPGPRAALMGVLAAANITHSGGLIWWVNINQTDSATTAPGVVRKVINHQYPNWYPSSCDNATAIAGQQTMFCHGGSVIECWATVQESD